MFSSIGSLNDPVFPHSGWQRDIDRVEIIGCNHFIISTNRSRCLSEWNLTLTFVDKTLCLSFIAARNCDDYTIAGIANRIPIFTRNIRCPQNSPSQFSFHES